MKSALMWAAADALGLTLNHDEKTGAVTGEMKRDVYFGNLPVTLTITLLNTYPPTAIKTKATIKQIKQKHKPRKHR